MLQATTTIFQGSFGIGKTFSIIFFTELAKYVNKLKYLSYGKWVENSEDNEYKK
jgi:hypothetical protein